MIKERFISQPQKDQVVKVYTRDDKVLYGKVLKTRFVHRRKRIKRSYQDIMRQVVVLKPLESFTGDPDFYFQDINVKFKYN